MADKILSDMDFEQHLQEMGDDQLALLKFVARQQYSMSLLCPLHDKRLKNLENRTKKEIGVTGGISAIVGGAIIAAINYFTSRWQ